jgi:hypothetical protein
MQFVEHVEQGGLQKFEIDLFGFGFLGLVIPDMYKGKLIKIDLYLHQHGKASIRNALVDKIPKVQRNENKKPITFRNVSLPYNV